MRADVARVSGGGGGCGGKSHYCLWRHFVLSCCLLPLLLLPASEIVEATDDPSFGAVDEMNLMNYLFKHKGYNPLIRPVANLSDHVVVQLELAMIQLIHVEEKNQIMKSNVWIRMQWKDYQLQWDISDFGGIDIIRVSPSKVWKPDIVLFNNADGKYEVSWQPNILIYNSGSILWIPPSIYMSSCTIDVTYFPFDQQQCEMKFGSWTFDATQVALGWMTPDKRHVDLTNYWKSGTWDIVSCPGVISSTNKTGQRQQTEIIYTITLRRKTLFYTVNLIIPCVLISLLSVCVFYLPADAGEKMTLCISILFALVVFQLLVSKILPPTSISIPLISTFLLFTFILNIVTITVTVVIINWNFRTPRTHKMPPWVKTIFMHYLPIILFMKRPNHVLEEERQKRRLWQATKARDCNGGVLRATVGLGSPGLGPPGPIGPSSGPCRRPSPPTALVREPLPPPPPPPPLPPPPPPSAGDVEMAAYPSHTTLHHPKCKLHHQRQQQQQLMPDDDSPSSEEAPVERTSAGAPKSTQEVRFLQALRDLAGVTITDELRQAVAAINFISTHLQVEDEYKRVLEDWKYVASVIDRVHLVIFVTVTIVGTISVVMHAPYILQYVDQDEIKRLYSSTS